MTDSEKVAEWVRYYEVAVLKFNALRAVYKNDPKLLPAVLKRLGLASAEDVVRNCGDR